ARPGGGHPRGRTARGRPRRGARLGAGRRRRRQRRPRADHDLHDAGRGRHRAPRRAAAVTAVAVAIAAGDRAVDLLLDQRAATVASGEVAWVRHEGLAVSWPASSPWVDRHDDGDVLVVLDGRLHNLWSSAIGPAALLAQRYASVGAKVANGLFGD